MKECIILAGGLGTRLQLVVQDVPKCMANVAGKPFLEYIFMYLEKEKFNHVILSLGYKAEIVTEWVSSRQYSFDISFVVEDKALGTGGAIKFASSKSKTESFFVINGDTFFDINTDSLERLHKSKSADITIALKPMTNFDRYGSVDINEDKRIILFNEKQFCEKGTINGGIYLISKDIFTKLDLPEKFSFETDIMEKRVNDINIFGSEQDCYFIDIGIPSDFEKANKYFQTGIK